MDVLIQYQYRVSRKEPYGVLLRRLHDGLVNASLPVSYQFSFTDSGVSGGVSAVDRAVKKLPQLAALVQVRAASQPEMYPPHKSIAGDDADLPFSMLAEVADGLPRSLPFNSATVVFSGPAFGDGGPLVATGIVASDSWWVNGRKRSLVASFVSDVEESARALPAPGGALGVFLAELGKPSKINRSPLVDVPVPGLGERAPAPSPVDEIAQKYRTRLRDLAAAAGMPHSLPAPKEAPKIGSLHALKPALDRHFGPLGYSCKGGSGTFTLQRRTASNQVVEVFLDVGTWSRRVRADFCVHVFPGRRYTFPMPVAPGLDTGTEKYPIGDEERWEKIVANLAVLAGHLDRQIVPEIEAAAGQAPVWFEAPK